MAQLSSTGINTWSYMTSAKLESKNTLIFKHNHNRMHNSTVKSSPHRAAEPRISRSTFRIRLHLLHSEVTSMFFQCKVAEIIHICVHPGTELLKMQMWCETGAFTLLKGRKITDCVYMRQIIALVWLWSQNSRAWKHLNPTKIGLLKSDWKWRSLFEWIMW